MEAVLAGVIGSSCAGAATGFGALPLLFLGPASARRENHMLGFAAGVMVVAAFFSLIAPAIARAGEQGLGPFAAALLVAASVLAGASGLAVLGRRLIILSETPARRHRQAALVMVLAITLHNLPEGAAVGVAFAGGREAGLAAAFGIGIQNIPEGMAVTGTLLAIGFSRARAALGALASGLVEPLAGAPAALAVSAAQAVLPIAFGAAAGAMLQIVLGRIVPDGHRRAGGHGLVPGFFLGFAVMLVLDSALG